MLGLNTITTNKLKLEIQGCNGYLSNNEVQIRLHYIRHRFYIKAAMMNGYYNEEDYTNELASWYNMWYDDFDTENMVYGIASEDDAQVPICGDYILENEEATKPKTLSQL
eukprot:2250912-Amphidinium_carterae.1